MSKVKYRYCDRCNVVCNVVINGFCLTCAYAIKHFKPSQGVNK